MLSDINKQKIDKILLIHEKALSDSLDVIAGMEIKEDEVEDVLNYLEQYIEQTLSLLPEAVDSEELALRAYESTTNPIEYHADVHIPYMLDILTRYISQTIYYSSERKLDIDESQILDCLEFSFIINPEDNDGDDDDED